VVITDIRVLRDRHRGRFVRTSEKRAEKLSDLRRVLLNAHLSDPKYRHRTWTEGVFEGFTKFDFRGGTERTVGEIKGSRTAVFYSV
jgi:hypothetical protein